MSEETFRAAAMERLKDVDVVALRAAVDEVIATAKRLALLCNIPASDESGAVGGVLLAAAATFNGREFVRLEGRLPEGEEIERERSMCSLTHTQVFIRTCLQELQKK